MGDQQGSGEGEMGMTSVLREVQEVCGSCCVVCSGVTAAAVS